MSDMTTRWRRGSASAVLGPAVLTGVLTGVLTACTPAEAAPDKASPDGATASPAAASADLARLVVAPEGAGSTYRRTAFGKGWADLDRNGCSTRDDILSRDLAQVRRRNRCVVVAGVLADPYTGRTVQFTKERAADVQIDHVVSLAEAWRSGAERWTPEQRIRFANDPLDLLATAGAVNEGKGDEDAGTWSPVDRQRACLYARHVVAVKLAYELSVDRRERGALAEDLGGCATS